MGLESLGKKLAQLGQDTKSSVQKMSESYQVSGRLSDAKKELSRQYERIGTAVAERYGDAPLEGLEEEFEAVRAAKERIAELEKQVQSLKGVVLCPQCGREAPKGERFCSACGAKLPEMEDDASKLKEDAKMVGRQAGDLVNEAADKARDFLGNVAGKADSFMKGVSSRLSDKEQEGGQADETDEASDGSPEPGGEAQGASGEAAPDAWTPEHIDPAESERIRQEEPQEDEPQVQSDFSAEEVLRAAAGEEKDEG